jgi:gas vesicle protein GvpL/GvpF
MNARGRYLFAVATGLDPSDLRGQEGLDGRPLEVVEHGDLQAVVCDVDLGEFGEGPVRQNLEQLAWVEKVARTHDSVVRAVAARATVAPMRLVTVCLDDNSVTNRLEQWELPLRAALRRVEGCREWSVKVYQAGSGADAPAAGNQDSATTGTAYLQRKREASGRRVRADREATDSAEAIHVALAGRSKASRLLTPQDPQLTERTERQILNGAYLLPDPDEQALRSLVDELRGRHANVLLEVAGPWAPYSFAVLEEARDG